MAFTDLHEGILREFATARRLARDPWRYELRGWCMHIENRENNSQQCAARQRELRRDPILGDAYRAKLATARRAYRARLKGAA